MNENVNTNQNNNGGNNGGANPPANQNGGENKNDANNNGGQNNQNNVTPPTFDTAKISDADFGKIFDDPRTFQHSRFKELNDLAQKGKAAAEAEAKRQQDEAVKKGEFDKVLGEKDTKISQLTTQLQTSAINQNLTIEAQKAGAVDIDAVLKLVDRSAIKIDDAGNITGAKEALEALLKDKPYLGKPGTQRLGDNSNPGNQNTGDLKRFKRSEIENPEFYRANEKDILASIKAGLVENDL